jgi:hypothetical protein
MTTKRKTSPAKSAVKKLKLGRKTIRNLDTKEKSAHVKGGGTCTKPSTVRGGF